MKCIYCSSNNCIKKGKQGFKQKYYSKTCQKYFQSEYSYKLFKKSDEKEILSLNASGCGISATARHTGYSKATICRKIIELGSKVKRPILTEYNQ